MDRWLEAIAKKDFKEEQMEKIIAYCGLVCTDYEAYIATQANDRAAEEEIQ